MKPAVAAGLRPRVGRRLGLALSVAAVCPLLVALASRIVYSLRYVDTDFFTFWLAAHLNASGQSPYSPEAWAAAHRFYQSTWLSNAIFPYPLPLATLLTPLGWLPLDRAYVVWVAASMVLIAAAGFLPLIQRGSARVKHYIVPVAAGLLLFRPLWATLTEGQLGGLWVFVLALAACLWADERWVAGGVLIAFVALKPTLGVPLLGMVGLWLIASRRWRALLGIAVSGGLMALTGFVLDRGWVGKFLGAGQAKLAETFGHSPSLWGMAGALCQHNAGCTVWLGGLLAGGLALAVCAALLLAPGRFAAPEAIGLSIVVTLLITPYIWAYDQILLVLPIVLVTAHLMRTGAPYLAGALFFLAVDVGALVLLLLAVQTQADAWSGLVPAAVGLAVWWSIAAARRAPSITPAAVAHPA